MQKDKNGLPAYGKSEKGSEAIACGNWPEVREWMNEPGEAVRRLKLCGHDPEAVSSVLGAPAGTWKGEFNMTVWSKEVDGNIFYVLSAKGKGMTVEMAPKSGKSPWERPGEKSEDGESAVAFLSDLLSGMEASNIPSGKNKLGL